MELVLGAHRTEQLVLTGHKGCFGHTELAAGIIAVITSTLALCRGSIPAHREVICPFDAIQHSATMALPLVGGSDIRHRVAAISGHSGSCETVGVALTVLFRVGRQRASDHESARARGVPVRRL